MSIIWPYFIFLEFPKEEHNLQVLCEHYPEYEEIPMNGLGWAASNGQTDGCTDTTQVNIPFRVIEVE